MADFYDGPRWVSSGLAVLLLLAAAMAAPAHHSLAPFDRVHGTIVAGRVTQFAWKNPHALISLDVIAEDDGIEHWTIQMETPNLLRRYGWAADTLKAGDRIAVTGGRAKDGSFVMRAVSVELTDGRKLPAAPDN